MQELPGSGLRAVNQMSWAIRRGQKMCPSTKKVIECFAEFKNVDHGKALIAYQDLYACSDDPAPTRLDTEWTRLGRLRMNLSDAALKEKKLVRKATGQFPTVVTIPVKITLSPGTDKGTLLCKASTSSRMEVGECFIEYEADPTSKGRR
jgi:hypothetical protein